MRRCLICHRGEGNICSLCDRFIAGSRRAAGSSLYHYDGGLRSLVIQAKVGTCYASVRCLIELFLQHEITQNTACDLVIPCPSSLYSRLVGRFDLAYLLAEAYSKHFRIPLQEAPFSSYWQLQKQSRQKDRMILALDFSKEKGRKKALIIDDVITSGYTIKKVANEFPHYNCSYLTFASAKKSH